MSGGRDVHMTSFGESLRSHRRRAGLTQEGLAERAELSVRAVRDLEAGRSRRPRRRSVMRLADALRLDGDEAAELDAAARHNAAGDAATSNLPHPPTPLIGRDADVRTVGGLLADPLIRVVTVVGPPGVGKTRLAVEVAGFARTQHPDGVWFADLGGVGDAALVPTTVAAAAGVRIDGVASVTDALVAHWRTARVLLVLDNCEHVLEACATLVRAILAGCGGVSTLATSREPLRVRGEHEVPLGPLAVPRRLDTASLDALAAVPSVALLLARINEVNPRFALTGANAAAVVELCRRLDGLPLALELTARWARLLTAEELVARLDSSLDVLRDGPVDLPARQRTVRDAVRWSYDLLAPAEQAMFRRLAVFAGGATLDAAAVVSGAAGALGDDPVIVVSHLVAASLLQRSDDPGGRRLRMLAVVREFASELLRASPEAEPTTQAHAAYYSTMARASDEGLRGPDQQAWLERLTTEGDNLRSALAWHRDHDVTEGLSMASALWLYWDTRAQREEARSWLEALLAADCTGVDTPARAAALRCLGNLDFTQRRLDAARARFEDSIRAARQVGDDLLAARATANLGLVASSSGDWTSGRRLYEQALADFRRLGHDWLVAYTLGNLGHVTLRLGDTTGAVAQFEEARATFVRLGDGSFEVWCLNNLADALHRHGDRRRARTMLAEGLSRSVALYREQNLADALVAGGLMALDDGEYRRAELFLSTALHARVEYLDHQTVASNLTLLAEAAVAAGNVWRAACLLGAATGFVAETGDRLGPYFQTRYDRTAGEARAALRDAGFDAAWRVGRAAPDRVITEAAADHTDDVESLIAYIAS